jgi:predicted DsbA family dithiol-disulfide isomerase
MIQMTQIKQQRSHSALVLLSVLLLAALNFTVIAQTTVASRPLAEVAGKAITNEEVERALGPQLAKLEEQIYQLKQRQLETLIAERLLAAEAAKRGITLAALLETEVTAKAQVTDAEVETFYQSNKARFKGDETILRQRIKSYLQQQKVTTRREALLQPLRAQTGVIVHLKAPPIFRTEVAAAGAPFRGSETAAVTIIEFSDFHCPFCRKAQPALAQVLAKYGEQVRLVYRHLPVDALHPRARQASEATMCANEQGKFWAYHDKLYAGEPEPGSEKLKAYAGEIGLNTATFESCLMSGKYQAAVQQDVAEGARLGITGTPSFFINGRMLSGAQSFENFNKIIEEELALSQKQARK